MTIDDPRKSVDAGVLAVQDELLRWLLDSALPLWDLRGVDRATGGYFEELASQPVTGEILATGAVRRGRVVARQIFVFEAGQRLGWRSPLSNPVVHGSDYLFAHLHAGAGHFHAAVNALTREPAAAFSLYEVAFYLFALARLHVSLPHRHPTGETATLCRQRLQSQFGRVRGGFEESLPPSLPLKSNPHMHLLEAALAWVDVTHDAARVPWLGLASELARLCLDYFADARSGAIREYFDDQWQPLAEDGRIVEPGHQFEWAWLLMKCAKLPQIEAADRLSCTDLATRLVEIGETWGVDPVRGVAINQIWDDMSPKDLSAKLWPQAERLKAWCAMLLRAGNALEAERAALKIVMAAEGLLSYLKSDTPGLWREVCSPNGEFERGPSKASSLYHIVYAIEELTQTINAFNPNMV